MQGVCVESCVDSRGSPAADRYGEGGLMLSMLLGREQKEEGSLQLLSEALFLYLI